MKAVVSVVGQDKVGIIADVSRVLSENSVNILDISQTIMNSYFTMVMVTDIKDSKKKVGELKETLSSLGGELGVEIGIQHEEIFNSMHKI